MAGRQLYVGNLPFNVQWQELKDMFRHVGNVVRAEVQVDNVGRSRGFGQVKANLINSFIFSYL